VFFWQEAAPAREQVSVLGSVELCYARNLPERYRGDRAVVIPEQLLQRVRCALFSLKLA